MPETNPPAPPGLAPAGALAGLFTYRIETWGCQMNVHDSEKMAGVLESFGLRQAAREGEADIFLLNTCSVREKAAQKIFTRLGQLRRYKQRRPHVVLGVCGCVAQQEQDRIFDRAPFVDIVMGPRRIASLPELIEESRHRGRALGVFEPKDGIVPEIGDVLRISRTRAYVTVMEGCNKNCTFCIVPFTRGRESYRGPEAILREVRECVNDGLVEVELLGQNVNAWNAISGGERWDFTRLLGAVSRTHGLRRLRFSTSHPLHFKNSIIEAMAEHETICKHLHFPVQSGSDAVLKRMRRGYTRRDYIDRVRRLREAIPDVALSTDIIVGFPGETEEDFDLTLDLMREISYDSIYSFLYSPRPGTPATDWEDGLDSRVKKQRLRRLQEEQKSIQTARNAALVGRVVEILVEGPSSRGNGQMSGRTSQNHVVNLDADPALVGRFASVRIVRAGPHSLAGELIGP